MTYEISWLGLFSLTLSIFLLMDPIGNVPMFLSVLKSVEPRRQRAIIFRELLIALVTIIAFAFLGEFLLKLLKITQPSLLLAGGIILFMIALQMIFPSTMGHENHVGEGKEPFIVPLAIPLIAGPSVLAAVMIYSRHTSHDWILVVAIVLAWIVSALVLLSSSFLKKVLGDKGLVACERLMGLILILIAIQMFLEGVEAFVASLP